LISCFPLNVADAVVLVLFSCLGGFFLGRHSAQAGFWPLLPQQQPHDLQQHRSSSEWTSDSPSTCVGQLLQYAALAWQQLRHVLLAIAAAGAKCAAALLALLAVKASDAAAAASDAAAAAALHVRRQCGAQYLDAPGYDGSDGDDVDDRLSSVQDQDSTAPSFITFLTNNKQQRLSLQQPDQQDQQQQQQVAVWQGMHSQPPAPPAAAAAAGDSLTFATPCNSSWNDSDACRTAAASAACRNRHPSGSVSGGSFCSGGSSSSRTRTARMDSGPLPMSGAASVSTVTPLGCGWMCVMSRSSPAVEAAAAQPGAEQQQQRQQQQQLDGNIAQQLAGEDISLGERGAVLHFAVYTKPYPRCLIQQSVISGCADHHHHQITRSSHSINAIGVH
jgi:hypothetical protein